MSARRTGLSVTFLGFAEAGVHESEEDIDAEVGEAHEDAVENDEALDEVGVF